MERYFYFVDPEDFLRASVVLIENSFSFSYVHDEDLPYLYVETDEGDAIEQASDLVKQEILDGAVITRMTLSPLEIFRYLELAKNK